MKPDNSTGVCTNCIPLCATTEAQLQNRLRNMRDHPTVQTYPCSVCGGTEWATTRMMVVPDTRPRWRQLVDRLVWNWWLRR